MGVEIAHIFEAGDYEAMIGQAANLLKRGGVVVLPTETVYGAAALLSNPGGLKRLRELAPPMPGGPLVVHVANPAAAMRVLGPVSDLGRRMMTKLWPGPVGLVFDVPAERQKQVAAELGVIVEDLYDQGSVALRCPDHVVATEVIEQAGGLLAIRKIAGLEQSVPATPPSEWEGAVDWVLDAGPTRFSKASTLIRIKGEKYEIVRTGVYDQRIIEKMLRTTILFVCSGNTCRSPMAEALARQLLARKLSVTESDLEKKGISVLSAGSFAMPGARAAQPGIEAVKELGADLSRHRSRPLTVELIHQADVIYAMSRNHVAVVAAMVPSAADKVMTLDPDGDIEDPIGGDLSLYRSLAGQLRELIEKRLEEQPIP